MGLERAATGITVSGALPVVQRFCGWLTRIRVGVLVACVCVCLAVCVCVCACACVCVCVCSDFSLKFMCNFPLKSLRELAEYTS